MAISYTDLGKMQINDRSKEECLDYDQWIPGCHEVESYQHESDLHDKMINCKKNPSHREFIPVSDFCLLDLPEDHRNHLWLKFIQTVISLTVRLNVKCMSKDRPDFWSGICWSWSRVGSGMVGKVYRKFTEMDNQTCPCSECKKFPDSARTHWDGFDVYTANHVVFNTEECKHTMCDIWFDRVEDKNKCPKLEGVAVTCSNIKEDYCHIQCVTHDENVYRQLAKMVAHYDDIHNKLRKRHKKSGSVKDMSKVPVVCVSHPHGMSKHVSVGMGRAEEKYYPRRWSYTTQTCPGSSGAPVFALGRWDVYGRHSVHSRNKQEGENECGNMGWWY